MIWVVLVIICIKICQAGDFQSLTQKILNWYEFSPHSLNVDSCLGLKWSAAFDPTNKRLEKLVDECTTAVQETEPQYWKKTQFVFHLNWHPVEPPGTRKMLKSAGRYTKSKFDEDFTDNCFSQIPSCRFSHMCVRYIFAPPGRKYFVTHQLLLSVAYRINCAHDSLFWTDLKQNEKALCGSIYEEVRHKIELCDLRLEQVLLCGMAGFKGFLSQKWKTHLLDAIDTFEVKNHEFACIKHKTARMPVYPLTQKAKQPKEYTSTVIIPVAENSVSQHRKHSKKRKRYRRYHSHAKHRGRHSHAKHRHRHTHSSHRHSHPKYRRRNSRSQHRKRRSHMRHRDHVGHSLFNSVWKRTRVSKRRSRPTRVTARHQLRKGSRVSKKRKGPVRVSAREQLRRVRRERKKQEQKHSDTLLDVSFLGRRNLHSKIDEFGCDSHTTALLIANFLLMK